jgi:exonuclease SbcC
MIESVTIDNYQSHRASRVELHPGVNMFVGQSDSGKSAILRALRWHATNHPLGDAFKARDGAPTRVVVELVGGTTVVHAPSSYTLSHKTNQQQWSAIGASVPDTVLRTLNISDLSWQSQMDAPFLLSASPGDAAKATNKVADLDRVDIALANINRMARDARISATHATESRQQVALALSAYRGLDTRLARCAALKKAEARCAALEQLVARGEDLLLEERQCRDRLARTKDTAAMEQKLAALEELVEATGRADAKVAALAALLERAASTQKELVATTRQLHKLEDQWKSNFPRVCPLCGRTT